MRISDWSSDVCSSDLPKKIRKLRNFEREKLMLERLEKFVRFVSVILLICSAAAILTMPLVIGYSTIARYLVGYPLSITEEFSSFLLVSCVFLALPYAAMEGKHVKFSMFLSMMSERQRVYCELITNIAAFLFMRSEEHTSELQSLMRISYAVFCLKKKIENI